MGLIAHWKLDGDATDSGPSGYDGTASTVTYTDGKIGQAGVFNGTSSYISLPSGIIASIRPSQAWSLSIWVNIDTINPAGGYVSPFIVRDSGSSYMALTWDDANNRFYTNVSDGSAHYSFAPTATALTWYHIVIAYDGQGNNKFYQNGALVDSDAWGTLNDFTPSFGYIGAADNVGSGSFDGLIDDVRLYDYQVSLREVQELSKAKNFQVMNPQDYTWGPNLFDDADCEAAIPSIQDWSWQTPNDCTVALSTDYARSGSYSLKVTSTLVADGDIHLSWAISSPSLDVASQYYKFSFWLYMPSSLSGVVNYIDPRMYKYVTTAQIFQRRLYRSGFEFDKWIPFEIILTPNEYNLDNNISTLRFFIFAYLFGNSSGDALYFDDFSLQKLEAQIPSDSFGNLNVPAQTNPRALAKIGDAPNAVTNGDCVLGEPAMSYNPGVTYNGTSNLSTTQKLFGAFSLELTTSVSTIDTEIGYYFRDRYGTGTKLEQGKPTSFGVWIYVPSTVDVFYVRVLLYAYDSALSAYSYADYYTYDNGYMPKDTWFYREICVDRVPTEDEVGEIQARIAWRGDTGVDVNGQSVYFDGFTVSNNLIPNPYSDAEQILIREKYYFNGEGYDYIDLGETVTMQRSGSTLIWWMKPLISQGMGLLTGAPGTSTVSHLQVETGRFYGETDTNCNEFKYSIAMDTDWAQYAIVFDNNQAFFYKNGSYLGESSDYGLVGCSSPAQTELVDDFSFRYIGAATGYNGAFLGEMADMRLYQRAFSGDEISAKNITKAQADDRGTLWVN